MAETSESGETERKEATSYPPLTHEWCLYCDDGNFYGGKAQNYFEQMVKLGSFNTVENFWRFFNATEETLRRLSPEKFNMRMFKSGIKPMWEDPNNRKGGKWLISCKLRLDAILTIWKEILVAAISGFPSDSELSDLCGCVLVGRRDRMEVQLWTRKKPAQENIETTCEFIRRLTREPTIKNVQFISHQKAKKKRSKRLAAVGALMSLVEEQKSNSSQSLPSSPLSATPATSIPSTPAVPTASSVPATAPPTLSTASSRGDGVKKREGPLFQNGPVDHNGDESSSGSSASSGGSSNSGGSSSGNSSSSTSSSSSSGNGIISHINNSNGPKQSVDSPTPNGPTSHSNKPPSRVASPNRVGSPFRSNLNPLSKPFAPTNTRTFVPSPEPFSPVEDQEDFGYSPSTNHVSPPPPSQQKPSQQQSPVATTPGQGSGSWSTGGQWAKKDTSKVSSPSTKYKPLSQPSSKPNSQPSSKATSPLNPTPMTFPNPTTKTSKPSVTSSTSKPATPSSTVTTISNNKPFTSSPPLATREILKPDIGAPQREQKKIVASPPTSTTTAAPAKTPSENFLKLTSGTSENPESHKEIKEVKEKPQSDGLTKEKETEDDVDETSETTEGVEEDGEEDGDVTPSETSEDQSQALLDTPKKKKPKRRKHKSTATSTGTTTTADSKESDESSATTSTPKKKRERKLVTKKNIPRGKKMGKKKVEEVPVERETTCKRLTTTMKSHCIIL